jgi:glutaredoxin
MREKTSSSYLSCCRYLSVVAACMVCACLSGAVRADSTIEVIKGTSKQRVRAGEASREVAPAAQELPRVEVFVTDWCPYCQRLEAFLKENQILYERKNIEQQAGYRKEHEELGGGGIPVTRIGGTEIVRGFAPAKIAAALGITPR